MDKHKVSEVKVDEGVLLHKGYSAAELVGKTFLIETIFTQDGQMGEYLTCKISGSGIDEKKSFITGAKNIVARLNAAEEQDLLPLEVKIVKLGTNAFDIV